MQPTCYHGTASELTTTQLRLGLGCVPSLAERALAHLPIFLLVHSPVSATLRHRALGQLGDPLLHRHGARWQCAEFDPLPFDNELRNNDPSPLNNINITNNSEYVAAQRHSFIPMIDSIGAHTPHTTHTHAHPHPHTHALTHSLNHSHDRSLTHSLTHSLTRSL